jgi:ATP synthase protein I
MNNRKLAELSSLALMLPSSIAVGLFFGYWLDKRLGTDPWMLMIFTLLGVAAGLIALIRGISKVNKEDL